MIRHRLEWKLESTSKLSFTQDAYRNDREGNDIVLRLIQSVQEAWNRNEIVIVFISDFKGFFDSIWRPLLIIKLQRAGVTGDILRLINDYLKGRKMRFDVNNFTTDWINSEIGTPQGSNLSSILSNIYSSDNIEEEIINHGEFSDDNLKWESNILEAVAKENMQVRIDEFYSCCKDNNIDASID
jgi:hypothetical protein